MLLQSTMRQDERPTISAQAGSSILSYRSSSPGAANARGNLRVQCDGARVGSAHKEGFDSLACSSFTQTKPGLASNGEERAERDGLYSERLTVHAGRDGVPQRLPVPRNANRIRTGVANPWEPTSRVGRAVSPKTGYEPRADSRQVASPIRYL